MGETGRVNSCMAAQRWRRQRIAQRIRQLGLERVVFGSDVSNPHGRPAWNWDQVFQLIPLTKDEFATIASNVTPYLSATRR